MGEEVSPMEIVAQLRKSRRSAEKSEQFETDDSEDHRRDELTYDEDTDVSILERAKRGLGYYDLINKVVEKFGGDFGCQEVPFSTTQEVWSSAKRKVHPDPKT